MLYLYDSLTAKKRLFKPLVTGKVGLYACGMTVYDKCHIGHARSMIAFDLLVRYLQACDYEVNYIRNITDIDDKIIRKAQQMGISSSALAQQCIDDMESDAKALNLLPPSQQPRATDYITEITDFIAALIDKQHAYLADNGDVYFSVKSFAAYGKLSRRSLDQLISGARVAVEEAKHNPLDFVLWKKAKTDEPSWPSPWGDGRPGWHIECSAMAKALLGQPFDIHGGGMDLKFPHHENEIAQSEACSCESYVHYWMHIGLVQVNDEKMSKSLGNFHLIEDVLKQYHQEVIRYWMLSSHYRSPVNYSQQNLQQASQSLRRFYTALSALDYSPMATGELRQSDCPQIKAFFAAMDDDLNTPLALSSLFELITLINESKTQAEHQQASRWAGLLASCGQLLGLLEASPADYLRGEVADLDVAAIEELIAQRQQARADKQWQLADDCRAKLLELGVEVEDTDQGATWRRR